ncbi:MAG TPA: VOC family protein [Gammaproteobacteria bacterium]
MKAAHPYLNFDGNAEEAFNYYKSVFGGEFPMVLRFRDFGGEAAGVAGSDLDRIAHIALALGDTMLMASDIPASQSGSHVVGSNCYISLTPDSAEEAERVFGGLAAGGKVEMPLQRTEWAEKYGSCVDRFGVRWMVNYAGNVRFGS